MIDDLSKDEDAWIKNLRPPHIKRMLALHRKEVADLSTRLAEAEREAEAWMLGARAMEQKLAEQSDMFAERNEALARNAALVEEVNDLLPDDITMFRHFKEVGCKSRADYARAAEAFYKCALATDAERDALARIRAEDKAEIAKLREALEKVVTNSEHSGYGPNYIICHNCADTYDIARAALYTGKNSDG